MLLSVFVKKFQSILAGSDDGELTIECLSNNAGVVLSVVYDIIEITESTNLHVAITGEE